MFLDTSDFIFYPQRQQRAPPCRKDYIFYAESSDDEEDAYYPYERSYPNKQSYLNFLRNQRLQQEQERVRQQQEQERLRKQQEQFRLRQQKQSQEQKLKLLKRAYLKQLEEELIEEELRKQLSARQLNTNKDKQSTEKAKSTNKPSSQLNNTLINDSSDQQLFGTSSSTDDENHYTFGKQTLKDEAKKVDSKLSKQQKRKLKKQNKKEAELLKNKEQLVDQKKVIPEREEVKEKTKQMEEHKIINESDSNDTVISEEPFDYWEEIGTSPKKNNLQDSLIEQYYPPEVESMAKQLSALLKRNYEECLELANNNKNFSIGQLIDIALNGKSTL